MQSGRLRKAIVATREGGVDRNIDNMEETNNESVATREGGVDRNEQLCVYNSPLVCVATREGGVDRNIENKQEASKND